jgi:hypothetical protein
MYVNGKRISVETIPRREGRGIKAWRGFKYDV